MAQTPVTFFAGSYETIDYTPGADVAAGDVVVINSVMLGIAPVAISDSVVGVLARRGGRWKGPKLQEAMTVGAPLYWDADGSPYGGTASSGALATTNTLGLCIGRCTAAAAETAEEVEFEFCQSDNDYDT